MIQTANAKERHTIPRWNSLNMANRLGELAPVSAPGHNDGTNWGEELPHLLDEWKEEKNIPLAIEILSTVEMTRSDIPIDDVVSYLKSSLSSMDYVPPMLSDIVFGEESDEDLIEEGFGVKQIKQSLIQYPRNPLLWSELAREYLIKGQLKKSELAIRTAYQLSPNNRTILRAISRLYAHERDYDQASYYLRKSPLINSDPWILSAEIAISSESGKASRYIKNGQRMLESANYDARSLSELGSELATLDYFSANAKQGKRKIERVLPMLHENAAAQIVWLDNNVHKMPSIISQLQSPDCNYEAETMLEVSNHNWRAAIDNAKKWKNYQPFSSGPAMVISYLLSDYLLEYQNACSILREALKANPNNVDLINNYAYALLMTGDLGNATDALKRAKKLYPSESYVPIIATEGLLYFRQGNVGEGRALYEKAIGQAKKNNDQKTLFEVYLHLAREEKICGHSIDEYIRIINSSRFSFYKSEFEDVIRNFNLE